MHRFAEVDEDVPLGSGQGRGYCGRKVLLQVDDRDLQRLLVSRDGPTGGGVDRIRDAEVELEGLVGAR